MKVFNGKNEVALSEEDVIQALKDYFNKRFLHSVEFEITDLIHCRSDSRYCLRFKINEL